MRRRTGADAALTGTVAASLHLGVRLTTPQRRKLNLQSNRVPTELIEAMATSSSVHGGTVAGTPFNADAAREVLTQVTAMQPFVEWAKEIAKTAADDVLTKRAALALQVRQRYLLLEAYVQNPEGADMLGEFERMQAMMKTGKRAKKGAPVVATTPTAQAAPAAGVAAPAAGGGTTARTPG